MQKKEVIIRFERALFTEGKRALPNACTLYTHIEHQGSWSLVVECESAPNEQGFETLGSVRFLVESAPHEILVAGFRFDFKDGANKIGTCEIV